MLNHSSRKSKVKKTSIQSKINLFKENNRKTSKRCEICSKLTIKPLKRQWRLFRFGWCFNCGNVTGKFFLEWGCPNYSLVTPCRNSITFRHIYSQEQFTNGCLHKNSQSHKMLYINHANFFLQFSCTGKFLKVMQVRLIFTSTTQPRISDLIKYQWWNFL